MTDVTLNSNPTRGKEQTAEVFLSAGQKMLGLVLILAAALYGVLAGPAALARVVVAVITVFYLVFVGFKLLVSFMGAGYRFPRTRDLAVDDPQLPMYSVLVPMRGETAYGFQRLVDAILRISYPVSKLQVLFVVDDDDKSTLDVVRQHKLLPHMQLVTVETIKGAPRNKPMSCNYAMKFVKGKRLVIWDFEDRAEVLQLLKAVATLNYWAIRDKTVACVQGMLQFWNPRGGSVNAFYWAEYVVNFRWLLPGLVRLSLIPPLGGTSNHFDVDALWAIDKAYGSLKFRHKGGWITIPNVWDVYNVTEDVDLSMRLAQLGYTIKMLDSVTFEEAPGSLEKAKNQRSRWLKGFLVTFLVQSRRPFRSMREVGVVRYLAYNLYVGGTPLSFLINPVMWATTVLYIASRFGGWESITLFIESLFPPVLYYPSMLVWLGGGAVLMYQMLLTTLRQQEHESFTHLPVGAQKQQYGLVLPLLLTPLWWIFTTVPAYKGFAELFNKGKRAYWNKTEHGDDMGREDAILGGESAVLALTGSSAPALTGGSSHVKALGTTQNRPVSLADATTAEQQRVEWPDNRSHE